MLKLGVAGAVRGEKINAHFREELWTRAVPNIEHGGMGADDARAHAVHEMGVYLSRTGVDIFRYW